MAEDPGKKVWREVDELVSERSTWEAHWREIADQIWPDLSGTFDARGMQITPGSKRTSKMFDSTAAIALTRFASVFESMVTPRNNRWHRLTANSPELSRNRDVQLWFDEVTDRLFKLRYAPQANFASQQNGVNMYLGAFGTGAMFVDEQDTPQGGIRYKACHLANVYLMENHQGIVDTAYRVFKLTARQAVDRFDKEKLPDKIVSDSEKRPNEKHEFVHVVKPRTNRDPNRPDKMNMPYMSMYVTRDKEQIVSEGGYQSFPYAVSRYIQMPGEVYGRSPGMLALPTVKTLNEQAKTVLKQGHRTVDPVLLAHDDGVVDTFSLKPGAINAGGVNSQGRALVQALPTGNITAGYQMMDQERQIINDVFMITLFQILTESPQMTATEVLERAQEKGALLSPTFGRQQSEYLGPLISRELDLMADQGMLPPLPPALIEAEGEYEIEYDSPLSRAQKAEEASGLIRTLEIVNAYVQTTQDPSPLDHFNWDEITPSLSHINAVPTRWMRAAQDIQQIRQSRQQEMQDQKAIEALPALSSMAKGQQQ